MCKADEECHFPVGGSLDREKQEDNKMDLVSLYRSGEIKKMGKCGMR